jgi:hypothetical protein
MWVKNFSGSFFHVETGTVLNVEFVDLTGTENDRYEIKRGNFTIARYNTEQEALEDLTELMTGQGYTEIIGTFDS